MFFTTNNGVNVIQFGSGDIEVGPATIKGNSKIGTVSLIPTKKPMKIGEEIDRSKERKAGMTDADIGVHTRLVFTDSRSIDVLVEALLKAKQFMQEAT